MTLREKLSDKSKQNVNNMNLKVGVEDDKETKRRERLGRKFMDTMEGMMFANDMMDEKRRT